MFPTRGGTAIGSMSAIRVGAPHGPEATTTVGACIQHDTLVCDILRCPATKAAKFETVPLNDSHRPTHHRWRQFCHSALDYPGSGKVPKAQPLETALVGSSQIPTSYRHSKSLAGPRLFETSIGDQILGVGRQRNPGADHRQGGKHLQQERVRWNLDFPESNLISINKSCDGQTTCQRYRQEQFESGRTLTLRQPLWTRRRIF